MYYEYNYNDLSENADDLYSEVEEYEYTETIEWQDYYHNLTQEIEIVD
jgi:hypothetical protein